MPDQTPLCPTCAAPVDHLGYYVASLAPEWNAEMATAFEDGKRAAQPAALVAQPPGAAEMARWMAEWDRGQPNISIPPTVVVKFSPDATPEEVETARDQIRSLIDIDEDRLLRALRQWDDQHTETSAAAIARAYREDSDDPKGSVARARALPGLGGERD